MISKKVILTGSFGVGKTSLFNQFIFNKFSDKYLTTIGVKVDKKTIEIEGEQLSLLLWDVAGEVTQDKIPTSYFLGGSGVVYVIDLTRPATFANIATDYKILKDLMPEGIIFLIGNKVDLVTEEQVASIMSSLPMKLDFVTSAKSGENVEALFNEMGKQLIDQMNK